MADGVRALVCAVIGSKDREALRGLPHTQRKPLLLLRAPVSPKLSNGMGRQRDCALAVFRLGCLDLNAMGGGLLQRLRDCEARIVEVQVLPAQPQKLVTASAGSEGERCQQVEGLPVEPLQ